MKNTTIKAYAVLAIAAVGCMSIAAPRRFSSAGNFLDTARSVSVDSVTGDIYVGGSYNVPGRGREMLLIKYNAGGAYIWGRSYGSVNEDVATDVLFSNGRIYATGYIGSVPGRKSMCIFSFDPAGGGFFARTYTTAGDAVGNELVRDGGGNIYVGGSGDYAGTGKDFLVAKYSPALVPIWINRWGVAGPDNFKSMTMGNGLYVCGSRTNAAGNRDAIVGRFNLVNGVLANARVLPGVPMQDDEANDIVYHAPSGDVLVVDTRNASPNDSAIVTFRLNANFANILWSNSFNPFPGQDLGAKVRFGLANVIVGGSVLGPNNYDYCSYALDPATGIPAGAPVTYNNGGSDVVTDMLIGATGGVILTGDSDGVNGTDAATIGIAGGAIGWVNRYNFFMDDNANALALAPNGNIMVCGGSDGPGTGKDLFTQRLDQATGANIW